jgi:heat shock protein HslJ
LEDGRTYIVQWFERARFEEHPENAPPYNVLFGRLGADILQTYMNPPVAPTLAPPTPTPGAGPGGCVPKMSFVSDVTVPNGTTLQPNASFVRTWRVRNDGTCYWDSSYRLVFSNGDQIGGPAWVSVPNTEPGAQANISVPLVAPATPGTYRGHWVMQASNGVTFGGLVVEINVAAAPAATAAPTSPPAATAVPTAPPAATAAPTAPPAATATATPLPSPVGALWRWQGTALSDGTRITVADPSRYTLQLQPDGTVDIKADCNQVGGTYTLNGASLTITLGPSSHAACPPDSQADVYLQQLAAVVAYR